MVKIGLVRCEMASRSCPGTSRFKAIKNGTGTLEEFKDEDIDIVGMVTCRGCLVHHWNTLMFPGTF